MLTSATASDLFHDFSIFSKGEPFTPNSRRSGLTEKHSAPKRHIRRLYASNRSGCEFPRQITRTLIFVLVTSSSSSSSPSHLTSLLHLRHSALTFNSRCLRVSEKHVSGSESRRQRARKWPNGFYLLNRLAVACSARPFCLICKEPIAPSKRANEETQAEDTLNSERGRSFLLTPSACCS